MPTEQRLHVDDQLLPELPPLPKGGPVAWRDRWDGVVVLDHGCGDAHLRAPLVARGATYLGLDPYSASSDLRAPGDAIPLLDDTLDVVISYGVLHLVPDPEATFREIARVVRPGGLLMGHVPFLQLSEERSQVHFTHLGLDAVLRRHGFALERLDVGATGIDYLVGVLLLPAGDLPRLRGALRSVVRAGVRAILGLTAMVFALNDARRGRGSWADRRARWRRLLAHQHASGHSFVARRSGQDRGASSAARAIVPMLRCPRTGNAMVELAAAPEGGRKDATSWLADASGTWAYPVVGAQKLLSAADAVALKAP